MADVLQEYYQYIQNAFIRFLNIEPIYLIIMVVGFILAHILVSFLFYNVYKIAKNEKKSVVWIPIINMYYVAGREIHSLFAILMIFETIFFIPFPHRINGVSVISGMFFHTISSYLFVLLVLEFIFLIFYMLFKYLRYEYSIKVVR